MSMEEEKLNTPEMDEEAGMDTFFADRSETEKPAKTGGMSKNIKALIVAGAALVLLGGGMTALLLMNGGGNGDSTDPTETTESAETIINASTGDQVKTVEINGAAPFKVYRTADATETETAVYTIEGYEDITMSQSMLSTLTNNLSNLSAELVEEDCTDLARYSLDAPVATVKLTYDDGTVFEAAIGEKYAIDTAKTYCAVGDDVYLIKSSLTANYLEKSIHFVDKTILAEPAEEEYPIVESLRVERTDWDYDLFLKYGYEGNEDDTSGGTVATHMMYEPVFAYLNIANSVDVTNGMFGLTALEVLDVNPDAAALAEAGLDEPFCKVTMQCDDGNTHVLLIGKTYTSEKAEELCYQVLYEGSSVIYGVSAESAVWATMKPETIVSQNIIASMVWDLTILDVKCGDKELLFEGNGSGASDTYTVTKNGVACDQERFRLFYKFLLSIYGEEMCFDEALPEGDPAASVRVLTKDGEEDYTVSFYALTDLTMMVAVDGVPTYKIRTSMLDALEHNIDIFDNLDEEFTTTWR